MYQAEAVADGKVKDSKTGTFQECAAWADEYIFLHKSCEIRIKRIGKE